MAATLGARRLPVRLRGFRIDEGQHSLDLRNDLLQVEPLAPKNEVGGRWVEHSEHLLLSRPCTAEGGMIDLSR